MKISLKTMNDQNYEVELPTTDSSCEATTVEELKVLASQVMEVADVSRLRMIFRGRVLVDSHLISEYGIVDGSVVHVVVRPETSRSSPQSGAQNEQQSQNQPSAQPIHRFHFGGPGNSGVSFGSITVDTSSNMNDIGGMIGEVLTSLSSQGLRSSTSRSTANVSNNSSSLGRGSRSTASANASASRGGSSSRTDNSQLHSSRSQGTNSENNLTQRHSSFARAAECGMAGMEVLSEFLQPPYNNVTRPREGLSNESILSQLLSNMSLVTNGIQYHLARNSEALIEETHMSHGSSMSHQNIDRSAELQRLRLMLLNLSSVNKDLASAIDNVSEDTARANSSASTSHRQSSRGSRSSSRRTGGFSESDSSRDMSQAASQFSEMSRSAAQSNDIGNLVNASVHIFAIPETPVASQQQREVPSMTSIPSESTTSSRSAPVGASVDMPASTTQSAHPSQGRSQNSSAEGDASSPLFSSSGDARLFANIIANALDATRPRSSANSSNSIPANIPHLVANIMSSAFASELGTDVNSAGEAGNLPSAIANLLSGLAAHGSVHPENLNADVTRNESGSNAIYSETAPVISSASSSEDAGGISIRSPDSNVSGPMLNFTGQPMSDENVEIPMSDAAQASMSSSQSSNSEQFQSFSSKEEESCSSEPKRDLASSSSTDIKEENDPRSDTGVDIESSENAENSDHDSNTTFSFFPEDSTQSNSTGFSYSISGNSGGNTFSRSGNINLSDAAPFIQMLGNGMSSGLGQIIGQAVSQAVFAQAMNSTGNDSGTSQRAAASTQSGDSTLNSGNSSSDEETRSFEILDNDELD